eukprot:13742314-Alexandrium_andersonii.AAC.1
MPVEHVLSAVPHGSQDSPGLVQQDLGDGRAQLVLRGALCQDDRVYADAAHKAGPRLAHGAHL